MADAAAAPTTPASTAASAERSPMQGGITGTSGTGRAGSPFPLPTPSSGRFLVVGGLYVDVVNVVAVYPQEDTSCRAISSTRARGGNAGNTAVVLSQLLTERIGCDVKWIGLVPTRSHPDSAFALGELQRSRVDTSHLEEAADGSGQPMSYITVSRENGSRTIVSTRSGLRELRVEHFASVLTALGGEAATGAAGRVCWCHLECRQMPQVLHMAQEFTAHRQRAQAAHTRLSVEVEKPVLQPTELLPLLRLCDLVLFSKEFLQKHQDEIFAAAAAVGQGVPAAHPGAGEPFGARCMRALCHWAGAHNVLYVSPWGAEGAYALDASSGRCYFQPALTLPEEAVVDTVGAGDTFIAAAIFALAAGADPGAMLGCACGVAGRKVQQVGFDGLDVDALPDDLAWLRSTDSQR